MRLTKKEMLDEIIYGLKMSDSADFEADDESYAVNKLTPSGYAIESQGRYIECRNLTAVRKEISKLGKKLLCL